MTLIEYRATLNLLGDLTPIAPQLGGAPGREIAPERGAQRSFRLLEAQDMDLGEKLEQTAAQLVAHHAALFAALQGAGVQVELHVLWEVPVYSGQPLTVATLRDLGALNVILVLAFNDVFSSSVPAD